MPQSNRSEPCLSIQPQSRMPRSRLESSPPLLRSATVLHALVLVLWITAGVAACRAEKFVAFWFNSKITRVRSCVIDEQVTVRCIRHLANQVIARATIISARGQGI